MQWRRRRLPMQVIAPRNQSEGAPPPLLGGGGCGVGEPELEDELELLEEDEELEDDDELLPELDEELDDDELELLELDDDELEEVLSVETLMALVLAEMLPAAS